MSANSPLVNRHITRVIADGGDASTIDVTWLQTAYAWLVSNSVDKSLLHWVDPAFGVAKSGSDITRIYDLGTTWLPRSMDLTPRDRTKCTYSATGLNSLIPAFINADGSSQMYWGRNYRYVQIRRKSQLTIATLYARTQTATDVVFAGIPTSSTTTYTFLGTPDYNSSMVAGISLKHGSGTPGTISFSLNDKSFTPKVATVTGSGATTQIAMGTYDGTTMKAYSDVTGGIGVTTLFQDPYHGTDNALSGARKGSLVDTPVLAVGDTMAKAVFASPVVPPLITPSGPGLTWTDAKAQFKASSIIVLGVGLDATKAASLYTLLKTRAGL
jgi:hypothetical protein